jgi:hypothetical protein
MAYAKIIKQIGASFDWFLYDLSSSALQGKSPLALLLLRCFFLFELDLKSDPSCLLTGFQASERPLA